MSFLKHAGAPIAAGLNLLGSKLQSRYQKEQQEREFKHNRQMSEYAYSKDLEQWNRANLYNAPTEQMARLRQAGLNPAMIYGSGGAKTVAAQLPKYQAPRANYTSEGPFNLGQAIGAFQSMKRMDAEINLVKAQTDNTKQMELNHAVNRALTVAKTTGEGFKNKWAKELSKYNYTMAFNTAKDIEKSAAIKVSDEWFKRKSSGERLEQEVQKMKQEQIRTKSDRLRYGIDKDLKKLGVGSSIALPIIKAIMGIR